MEHTGKDNKSYRAITTDIGIIPRAFQVIVFFYLEHIELENQFLTLEKGDMYIDEYTNAFTDKMEFTLRIVLDELSKIDSYAKGFPWEYSVPICNTLFIK